MANADLETGARSGRTWEVKEPVKISARTRNPGAITTATQKGLEEARKRLLAKARADYQAKYRAALARQKAWASLRRTTSTLLNPTSPKPGYVRRIFYVMNPETGQREQVVRWVPAPRPAPIWTPPPKQYSDDSPAAAKYLAGINRQLVASGVNLKTFYAQKELDRKTQMVLDQIRKEQGTAQSGAALEALLKDYREAQKATNGQMLNATALKQVYDAYQQHVQWVAANFDSYLERLKKLYNLDKNGNLVKPKSREAAFEAERITMSKEFQTVRKEYMRLYSGGTQVPKGGKIPQGGVHEFESLANEIGYAQRDLLYQIAKKTVFNRSMLLRKHGEAESAAALIADWKNGAQYLDDRYADVVKEGIDPKSTSWYTVRGRDGEMNRIQRTVDQEYEYRRRKYIERMRSEYALAQQRQREQEDDQRESMRFTREAREAEQDIYRSAQALGLDSFGKDENVRAVIKHAMETWDAAHPAPKFPAARFFSPDQIKQMQAYRAARSLAEQRYWTVFGSKKPGLLEETLQFPIVKGALDTLSSGFGAIGSASKVLATTMTGAPAEFIAAGDNLNINEFPLEQRRKVEALQAQLLNDKQWIAAHRGRGVTPALLRNQALKAAMHKVAAEYMQTPEGSVWSEKTGQTVGGFGINTGRSAADRERIYNDLSNFYQRFYVQGLGANPLGDKFNPLNGNDPKTTSGLDVGQVISGLSEYGSLPFSPDSWVANLVTGIAFDPFIKLPLKATTWTARVEHALDVTKDIKGISRLKVGAVDWLNVSEAELRLQKFLKPLIRAGREGVDERIISETLLAKLAHVKDKGLRKTVVEQQLEKMGITTRDTSYHQAFSLVEAALNKYVARKAGVTHVTLADQIRKTQEEAKAAAEEARRLSTEEAIRTATSAERREAEAARAALSASERAAAKRHEEAERIAVRAARPARPAEPVSTAHVDADAPSVHSDTLDAASRAGDATASPVERAAADEADSLLSGTTVRSTPTLNRYTGYHVVEGHAFAPGKVYDDFMAHEYEKIQELLTAKNSSGLPDLKSQAKARVMMAEASARSIAENAAKRESEGFVLREGGAVPESVYGAPIADPVDFAARHGAHTDEAIGAVEGERRAFELLKRELAGLLSRFRKGNVSAADLKAQLAARIDTVGSVYDRMNLERRITGDSGNTLDHLLDDLDESFTSVRLGERLVDDVALGGEAFKQVVHGYYDAFSLLKRNRGGRLMASILDPATRAGSLSRLLAEVDAKAVAMNPRNFASYGQALFAIFHLGIREDSAAFQTMRMQMARRLLDNPNDVLANMWRVMEARALLNEITAKTVNTSVKRTVKKVAPEGGRFSVLSKRKAELQAQVAKDVDLSKRFGEALPAAQAEYDAALKRVSEGRAELESIERGLAPIVSANKALFDKKKTLEALVKKIEDSARGKGATPLSAEEQAIIAATRAKIAALDAQIDSAVTPAGASRDVEVFEHASKVKIEVGKNQLSILDAEVAFQKAVLAGGEDLHPTLALGQISYGPLVRPLPSGHMYPALLRNMATAVSDLIREAPVSWFGKDKVVLDWIEKIGNKVGQMKDPNWAIGRATQIMHYIVTRYGPEGLLKHGEFAKTLEGMNEELFRRAGGRIGEPFFPKDNLAHLAGRDAVERKTAASYYWTGQLTHDNPGLHTLNYLFALANPELAHGQSWAQLSLVYLEHMARAGYLDQASELVGALHPQRRASAVKLYLEQFSKEVVLDKPPKWMPDTTQAQWDALPESERTIRVPLPLKEGKVPIEVRVFRRAGQIGEFKKHRADAQKRSMLTDAEREQRTFRAQEQWVVDEHQARVRRSDAQLGFANADFSGLTTAIAERLARLAPPTGGTPLSGVARKKALGEILDDLASLHRMTFAESFPASAMDDFAEMWESLRQLPEFPTIQAAMDHRFGADLMYSRVGEALGYKEFFERRAAARAAAASDNLPPQPVRQRAEFYDLQEKLRDVNLEAGKRARYEARMEILRKEIKSADDARNAAIAQRIPDPSRATSGRDALPTAEEVAERAAREADVERLRAQVNAPEPPAAAAPGPTAAPEPATPPLEDSLPTSLAARALEIISGMSEEQWLKRELGRARRAYDKAKGRSAKRAAYHRIQDSELALKLIEVRKTGGRFNPPQARAARIKRVVAVGTKRAVAVYAPGNLTWWIGSVEGASVEMGRRLRRLLLTAPVDPTMGNVEMVGDVSKAYVEHGAKLDEFMNRPVSSAILRRFGMHAESLRGLTYHELLSDPDELRFAMRNPTFEAFYKGLMMNVDGKLAALAGDPGYSLKRYFSDVLAHRDDFYDPILWEAHEKEFAKAIRTARGWRSNILARLRRRPGEEPESPFAEVLDRDIAVIRAKVETAKRLGTSVQRYNEARKVLNDSYLKRGYSLGIFTRAVDAAKAELEAAGHVFGSKKWQELWEEARNRHYAEERARWAATTAQKLLGELAGEMEHADIESILKEFEDLYTFSNDVKGWQPKPISPFQRRTLEQGVKKHLRVDDPYAVEEALPRLKEFGQGPPDFKNRRAMREWFVQRGIWTPRTAEAIEAGKKSWSIDEENKFFFENWADPPEWTRRDLLGDARNALNDIFHNERAYLFHMKRWGFFTENLEQRFRPNDSLTRAERARELARGNPDIGRLPKRDLALERKYAFERFGDLVGHARPLELGGVRLKAMPWLMTPGELRVYYTKRMTKAVADDLVQNAEELAVVERIINERIGKYFDAMMSEKAGTEVVYEDMMVVISQVVHDLLSDPVWAKRGRDKVGEVIRTQASIRRRMIFSHMAFAVTNAVDAQVKKGMYRVVASTFRTGKPLSKRASELDLVTIGHAKNSTLLSDVPVHGMERLRRALGKGPTPTSAMDIAAASFESQSKLSRVVDGVAGLLDLPAQVARMAEEAAKIKLAREMYDEVYARSLKVLGSETLADVAARVFIHDELARLWPTVGDGPIERLFNQLFPFFSYRIRNKTFYIGEMASHPVMFNYLNRIGNAIEQINRENWQETHGEEDPINDREARLIKLPWVDAFIDLGDLTDWQRGIAPIYKMADGRGMTTRQFIDTWVQVVSPNDANIVLGIMNEFGLYGRKGWVPVTNPAGYPTGEYRQVDQPWEAPWGGVAQWTNSFWPLELWAKFSQLSKKGLTAEEAVLLLSQLVLFGGIRVHDKGAGLNAFYFALKKKDEDAARTWLETTPEGALLKARWIDHAEDAADFYTPKSLAIMLNPAKKDTNEWFHDQSLAYQESVKNALGGLNALQAKWDHVISRLSPGTPEFKAAKKAAETERYLFMEAHPELYEALVMFQTPEEWGAKLDRWAVDDMMQTYYNMRQKTPRPGDFKTLAEYRAALAAFEKQKLVFLTAFPQVAERLKQVKSGLDGIWQAQEQHWFDVLNEVGVRGFALNAAKESKNFDLTDQLYLLNELSFESLQKDTLGFYYDPVSDFVDGELRKGPFGQSLLPLVKVLPDFNSWRYSRMNLQQRQEFEREQKYREGLAAIIAKAKASRDFGATFVSELKKHPDILREYFRQHPGKKEQWEANDAYIRAMQGWGRLIKAGRWGEAQSYFASLDPWMRARYYAKHPEKRKQMEQNIAYTSYMEKWTAFYRRRDYAGGAAYFASLPAWVRDRFYSANPDGKISGTSPYAKAMGKWVALLQDGKREEAKAYFDSLPQAYKDRYYAKHPQQKLMSDVRRVGQLQTYFAADDANRAIFLKENPEFARWLASQDTSESRRRMMILAAYSALPKDDQWLRRIFREKYPEVFSQEAKGLAAIRSVFDALAEHPDLVDDWQRWVEAILASYGDSLRLSKAPPKPIEITRPNQRTRRRGTHGRGESAAWVRLHAVV